MSSRSISHSIKKEAGSSSSSDEDVYMKSVLTRKITLHVTELGTHTKQNLETALASEVGNRCIVEGFVRESSLQLLTYSAGLITTAGDSIDFHVVYECMVAHPVEGMVLDVTVKTITKAGIHAEVIDSDGNVPVTVFVARDHHSSEQYFHKVQVQQVVRVRTIGIRFELNDPYICAIATLVGGEEV
jgi:DNA-directed RNA polymerase subunit E'/Rpb7